MYVCMSYYRVHQAEYVIRIRVAAPQEYVKSYSTCRLPTLTSRPVSVSSQYKDNDNDTKGRRSVSKT